MTFKRSLLSELVIAFSVVAARARKRVRFSTAEALIHEPVQAEVSNTLYLLLETLSRIDLLIIDELGYPPFSKQSAALSFKLISRRYEKASTNHYFE